MAKVKKPLNKLKVKNETVKAEDGNQFSGSKIYSISEAIKWVKTLGKEKFDASIEVAFKLGIDPKKGDQQVRGAVSLPHGTGKQIKIAAFVEESKIKEVKDAGADYVGGEDLIAQIKKTEKTDFQVAVAEPGMMKNLAQVAKILGTRGLMPSPKNETVTPNVAKAVAELKKGKISYKNDDTCNLHAVIGKKSFTDEQLTANFQTILEALKKAKPISSKGTFMKGAVLSSTMGKGVKVAI